MMVEFNDIENLIAANRLDEALKMIDNLIAETPTNLDMLYFYRGKINWRKGLNSRAISDFEHSVAINPDSKARHALEMARDVTDFFNPDLLNP